MTLSRPTKMEAKPATRALILAASGRVAPIRFAIRVDAAIEIGKGILRWGNGVSIVYFGGGKGGCRALEL